MTLVPLILLAALISVFPRPSENGAYGPSSKFVADIFFDFLLRICPAVQTTRRDSTTTQSRKEHPLFFSAITSHLDGQSSFWIARGELFDDDEMAEPVADYGMRIYDAMRHAVAPCSKVLFRGARRVTAAAASRYFRTFGAQQKVNAEVAA